MISELRTRRPMQERRMENGVCRWIFDVSAWKPSLSQFSVVLSFLPSLEQQDVTRFVRFEDQKRALVSRLMQRMLIHILFSVPYMDVLILRTKEGKPYVGKGLGNAYLPNLNFSISHHGHYVGLASEPWCLVGLDIMAPDAFGEETPEEYIKNFRSCFTILEWRNINSVGSEPGLVLNQFYRYWAMKESYIKALGVGLGFKLQRAEFYFRDGDVWSDHAYLRLDGVEKNDWCFHLFRLDNYHWACIAKGPPVAAVKSFKETLHMVDMDEASMLSALRREGEAFTEVKIQDIIPW